MIKKRINSSKFSVFWYRLMDLIRFSIATSLLHSHTLSFLKAFSLTISLPAQSFLLLFCISFFHLPFNHYLLTSKTLQLCGLFSSLLKFYAFAYSNYAFENLNFVQIKYFFIDYDFLGYFYFLWFECQYFQKQNFFPCHLSLPLQLD